VRKQKLHHDENGREYVLSDGGNGTRVKRYVEDAMQSGAAVDNVWDIDKLNNSSKERLGYPTQKPEVLLERIIKASSNEGDTVLDPFCGCGTTIAVAQRLNRSWIGIDITHIAISLIKTRLLDIYGESIVKTYTVRGEPTTYSEAQALALQDKYQFQWWALGLVGARRTEEKKGADQGIDGRLYFHDELESTKTKQVIFSIKGGKTEAKDIRDLRGVIERENAEIGVLITLQTPTKPMRDEITTIGTYQSAWGKHPRLQILTIEELLEGKRVDMPPLKQVNVTFKKAPKARNQLSNIPTLPFNEP
jgi:site-specific DNA-methyltransferase (adenine-specific)